ncbi:ATP-binding protein [Thalassorhabdus alkalitolerans]|uniref:histidine kinase n=2 Tax=Thalassorhabdus alkalitolerans TaxID=2282697 RepID=A0ABW0YMJ2_9BACI
MLVILGFYTNAKHSDTVSEQIGIRALSVAQSVAEIPEVQEAFSSSSPSEVIQPIAEAIRTQTDSEFIVVGNRDGERYSHPNEDRIGQTMVGDDNDRALYSGESYVSEATGSLGPSIRGKAPIITAEGEIIGVVSVGFLLDDVEMTIGNYVTETWYWIFLFMLIGIIGATLISLHVKRSILGLEPEEIGRLFQERESVFQSIHEAMIAVDRRGIVTMCNNQAGKLLQVESDKVVGKYIEDVIPHTQLAEVLETGERQFNKELWVNEERFIVNRVPIYYENKLMGAVSTFRNRTEVEKLAEELSNVKQYSEALRVQTHEFSNKLNTISGFLQLNQTKKAVEYINKESKEQQEWIHFFIRNVSDSYVSAVLLGKLNRAHELGIKTEIHPHSELVTQLTEKQRDGLVTVIGNLFENAFDAVLEGENDPVIHVFFTDMGHDILFEIEDSGPGIAKKHIEKVFQKGFTTKEGTHRGIGLSLVQQILEEAGGELSLETSELGGACFIFTVPKELKAEGGQYEQLIN